MFVELGHTAVVASVDSDQIAGSGPTQVVAAAVAGTGKNLVLRKKNIHKRVIEIALRGTSGGQSWRSRTGDWWPRI